MAVIVKKDFEAGDEVARMQGIGGNDAYAAANIMTPQMNGWATSQYELFNIKLGRQKAKDISDKPSVVWGSWLEGPVLEKINKTTKYQLRRDKSTHWSEKYPFMYAHIDATLVGNTIEAFGKRYKKVIAEIKCPMTYSAKNYGEEGTDEIPVWNLMQCIHYLVVHPEVNAVFVFVQLPHEPLRHYVVKRDKELLDSYTQAVCRFWSFVQEARRNPNVKGGPVPSTVHDFTIKNWDHDDNFIAMDTAGEEAWNRTKERDIQAKLIKEGNIADKIIMQNSVGTAQGAMLSDGTKLKCIRKDNRSYKEEDVKAKFAEAYKMCQKFDRPMFTRKFSYLVDEICETTQSVQFRELKK
jgi:predicted phage-related endonuclease